MKEYLAHPNLLLTESWWNPSSRWKEEAPKKLSLFVNAGVVKGFFLFVLFMLHCFLFLFCLLFLFFGGCCNVTIALVSVAVDVVLFLFCLEWLMHNFSCVWQAMINNLNNDLFSWVRRYISAISKFCCGKKTKLRHF